MIKYTSIKSVLYDLSLDMKEEDYDELRFTEWVTQAYRSFNLAQKYETKTALCTVVEHKTNVPSTAMHINQIAYKASLDEVDVEDIRRDLGLSLEDETGIYFADSTLAERAFNQMQQNGWRAMRSTTSTFSPTYFSTGETSCADCGEEYSISPSGCITTSFRNGYVLISYLALATDEDGLPLIPDHEDLKSALYHYVMYRYWQSKQLTQEVKYWVEWHLTRYALLKQKSRADITQPDLAGMENLKDMTNRLVPRAYRYDQFFRGLNNRENTRYS